jgi:hypothetical protein
MDTGNVKWKTGIKNIGIGFLLCGVFLGTGMKKVEAALLEGLLDGFEETLGESAEAKGERLIIGNFYQAERPDSHAPIGVMGAHTHNKGEFMFTYRYMNMFMNKNRDGTDNVSDNDVLQDFLVTPTEMTTQMHMFSSMYGLNDTVTLVAMFPYIMKSMKHKNRMGVKFRTHSGGIGDIKLGSLWRLYAFETPSIGAHRFHLNTLVSLPSGDIKPTDDTPLGNNSLLPYPMRLGSGTVDLLPGLTYTGVKKDVSWGFQAMGVVRLGYNNQGYKDGNRYDLNSWGAYRWTHWLSTSARVNWKQWFNIKREDGQLPTTIGPMNIPIVPTSETDLRGGKRLDLMGGFNILFPEAWGLENHLNVEAGAPVYQDLDGPQLKQAYSFWVGWQIIM